MTATGGAPPSIASVVRQLLDQRVISLDDAVERGLLAVDSSVSHLALRLRVGDELRLFAKRADPVRSSGRDLTTEAAVYRLARSNPGLAALIPPCRHVADDDTLIVMDDVGGHPIAATAYLRSAPRPLDDERNGSILGRYGTTVARVHHVRPPAVGRPPWLLEALEPRWGRYEWLPPQCGDLLMRLAATPSMTHGFRRAASAWRSGRLVHGDLRSSNVLVDDSATPPRMWLVDWELACRGDPAWDLGSVIGDFVAGSAQAAIDAGPSFDPMLTASAFLDGYRREAPSPPPEWAALIGRSVAMAGVRLVQTLVEYGHGSEAHLNAIEPILVPWIEALLSDGEAIGSALAADSLQRVEQVPR